MMSAAPNAGWIEQYSKLEIICSNGRNQLSGVSMKNLWFMAVLNVQVKGNASLLR